MSILDNAIKHASETNAIEVPVPEWGATLYFRKTLSISDFSTAVRCLATYDFKPLCKILVKYAETDKPGEKAFPDMDDAHKLASVANPGVIVRTVSKFVPSPDPVDAVEAAAKN